jgi:hypothetical protein
VSFNIQVHGSNARNLSVELSLSQTSKNAVFLIIAYVFSSTKSEKRAQQVLHGAEWGAQTMYTHVRNVKMVK